MPKQEADFLPKISIFKIMQERMSAVSYGPIQNQHGSYFLNIFIPEEEWVELRYVIRNEEGKVESIQNRVYLTSTPCHYGGVRYWFECPDCGERAGVLYRQYRTLHFTCRKCLNLTYHSRNRRFRLNESLLGMSYLLRAATKASLLASVIHRKTWRGYPTKKWFKLENISLQIGMRIDWMDQWRMQNSTS
jgi:hypothetical protein